MLDTWGIFTGDRTIAAHRPDRIWRGFHRVLRTSRKPTGVGQGPGARRRPTASGKAAEGYHRPQPEEWA